MADFCRQCSETNFGEDSKDLAGIAEKGKSAEVLCEGCGFTYVNEDGECVYDLCPLHGEDNVQSPK